MTQPDLTKEIVTEDGVTLHVGDHAYNYYDMEPGVIVSGPDDTGWFDFKHDISGRQTILNGQRICSDQFARGRGFRNAG